MRLSISSVSLLALALATSVPALAEPVETEAVIVSKGAGELKARTRQGPVTVTYNQSTAIRERDGLRRKTRDDTALIPGLIIQVDGDQQGEAITASRIEFRERDWRTAIATRAGTVEEFDKNAAQLLELRMAIINGQEYMIQQETAVYFATGNASVAPEYQAQLRDLAQNAASFGNYRISILGFADSRGDAAANERLSMRRATAVSNFVRQTGLIEPGRVLSPSAMGEGTLAPGETAPTSDAEARRVVVRIVTPKTQLSQ